MSNSSSNQQKYENQNPLQRYLIQRFFSSVQELLSLADAERILEVGCGEGYARQRLQLANACTYIGTDLSLTALLEFKKRSGNANLFAADLCRLPIEPKKFDLILALEVFEHIPKIETVLQQIQKTEAGFLLASVPHEPFFRAANFLRGKNISRFGLDADHYHAWSRSQFIQMMKKQGKILATKSPFPWNMVLVKLN